ncbi:unnamed protein product [Medioppia subpectinata]|uniref:Agenet-like domain-containing protein n=1 Tax=Medioppia subpectinata TaxID=1979941 RepID=A0A7R9Q559_9ACAR|nr:unnamed protein product [Medioppia subpectinata]CAG2113422.1 unnamed protein product [Medioppia subpectinata]
MSAKDTSEPTPKTIPASDGWVEVLGDNGAHYRAHVVDVMDGQRLNGGHQAMGSAVREAPQLTLAFEHNWHKMETFPVTRVRLPPMTATADTTNRSDYTIGQPVEVLTTAQEGEHPGLWKALIKDVKGDFFVVSYAANASNDGKGGDAQTNHMSDIVTKEQIRPMNTNPYLKTSPFFKFVMKVPKELVDMNAAMVQRSQTHQHFRTALSLVSVTFVDHMNILVCVGFAAEPTEHLRSIVEKRALLLADIHFRCLRQSFQLMANVKALTDQRDSLDDVIKHNDNGFEMYVEVEQHLIGLAIGSKGSNLKRVLTTPGVVSITHKDGVFHVLSAEFISYERIVREDSVMGRYGDGFWDRFVFFEYYIAAYIHETMKTMAEVANVERNAETKPSTSNEHQKPRSGGKREDSLSVVGVELIDSMATNPFVDRVFKAAITMVLFLLLSGVLWCISKIQTRFSDVLEQIAVTVFILTLVVFAVSGLVFMCSILLISTSSDRNTTTEVKNNINNNMGDNNV